MLDKTGRRLPAVYNYTRSILLSVAWLNPADVPLGKAEMVRGLRSLPKKVSPEHQGVWGREAAPSEVGNYLSLPHQHCLECNLGETAERRGKAHMGFSKRHERKLELSFMSVAEHHTIGIAPSLPAPPPPLTHSPPPPSLPPSSIIFFLPFPFVCFFLSSFLFATFCFA